jgi:hypothetical protein
MPISLAQAEAARGNISGIAFRTPLVRCNVDAPVNLYLKLENLNRLAHSRFAARPT